MSADLVGASEGSVEVSEDPAEEMDLLLVEVEASDFEEALLAALLAPSLHHPGEKSSDRLKVD